MTIEILDKLYKTGELRSLVLSGIVSVNVLEWRKIYHLHNERIKKGSSKMTALSETSEVFNISERSVYRIIEKLKYKPAEKPIK